MIAPVLPAALPAPAPSAVSPSAGGGSEFGDLLHSATTDADTRPSIADQNRERDGVDRREARPERAVRERPTRQTDRNERADDRSNHDASPTEQRRDADRVVAQHRVTESFDETDEIDADLAGEAAVVDEPEVATDETDPATAAALAATAVPIPTDATAPVVTTGVDAPGAPAVAPPVAATLPGPDVDGTTLVDVDATTPALVAGDETPAPPVEAGADDAAAATQTRPTATPAAPSSATDSTTDATTEGPAATATAPTIPSEDSDVDATIDLTDAGAAPSGRTGTAADSGDEHFDDAPAPRVAPAAPAAGTPVADVATSPSDAVAVAAAPAADAPAPHPAPVVVAAPVAVAATPSAPVSPAGALPPELAPEVHEQLVSRVSALRELADGAHELILELDPVELGHLRLEVVMRDGAVNLKIQADDPNTRALLQQTIADLRSALDDAGLQTGFLDVADQGAAGRESGEHDRSTPRPTTPAPATRRANSVVLPDRVDVLL